MSERRTKSHRNSSSIEIVVRFYDELFGVITDDLFLTQLMFFSCQSCLDVIKYMSGSRQAVVIQLSWSCKAVVKELSYSCKGVVRQSPDVFVFSQIGNYNYNL